MISYNFALVSALILLALIFSISIQQTITAISVKILGVSTPNGVPIAKRGTIQLLSNQTNVPVTFKYVATRDIADNSTLSRLQCSIDDGPYLSSNCPNALKETRLAIPENGSVKYYMGIEGTAMHHFGSGSHNFIVKVFDSDGTFKSTTWPFEVINNQTIPTKSLQGLPTLNKTLSTK